MNAKYFAVLALIATLTGLGIPAYAQSTSPKPEPGKYTLTGDSLTGINNRTSQDDFGKFFTIATPENTSGSKLGDNIAPNTGMWKIGEQVQFRKMNESITLPDTPLILQPAQSNNGNDGVQLQLVGE
jgi:hypothetical protein